MHQASSRFDFSNEVIILGLIWGVFALASPTRTGNYDFRHFENDSGLTLSVSRSAPPMAVLEDEKLTPLKVEPAEDSSVRRNVLMAAGGGSAWPKLRPYARFFEKKMAKAAAQEKAHSVTSLTKIVKFIPDQTAPKTKMESTGPIYSVRIIDPNYQPQSVAPRSPVVVPQAPVVVQAAVTQAPSVPGGGFVSTASAVKVPAVRTQPTRVFSSPQVSVKQPAASVPVKDLSVAERPADVTKRGALHSLLSGATRVDDGQKPAVSANDYTVMGQLELTGGLAATGTNTKVDIQWQSGGESRVGAVDYSNGQFEVAIPNLNPGKIVARLIDESGFVLGLGDYEIDGADAPRQKTIAGISILIEPRDSSITGKVVSAYNVGKITVPVLNGSVYGPASLNEMADKAGAFRLKGLSSQSLFMLEAYAPEHWGTRILASSKRMLKAPVFANKMMESFFGLVGKEADRSDFGVVWGEVRRKGTFVAGAQVKMTDSSAIGPIYFNELRIPDRSLKATTSNGLFAFARVKPGLQIVASSLENHELPSTLVSVAPSKISYSEIALKATTVQGQVIDPVLSSPVPARVNVVGQTPVAISSAQGFQFKVPSSDPFMVVEARGSDEYMPSRVMINKTETKNLPLTVYKKSWIKDRLAKVGVNFKPEQNIFIGYVSGPEFTVQLDDRLDPSVAADKAEPQIYYFGKNGELDSTLLNGNAGGNAFMITNLTPGLHTLVISSAAGDITTTRLFASEGGVANVLSLELRP